MRLIRCPHCGFWLDTDGKEIECCVDCGKPLIVPHHLDYVQTNRGKVCIACIQKESYERLTKGNE